MIPLMFILGALLGILVGGALCAHYLIGPQLRRMHADLDPQLRRMQNQLDNIESAVNLALVTRYAEMSALPWPTSIPAPRASNEDQRRQI